MRCVGASCSIDRRRLIMFPSDNTIRRDYFGNSYITFGNWRPAHGIPEGLWLVGGFLHLDRSPRGMPGHLPVTKAPPQASPSSKSSPRHRGGVWCPVRRPVGITARARSGDTRYPPEATAIVHWVGGCLVCVESRLGASTVNGGREPPSGTIPPLQLDHGRLCA